MFNNSTAVSSVMGLMSHLTASDLKEILNDDSKFEMYAKELKPNKEIDTEKEMLIASNQSLAEFNLTKEPELVSGKERLCEMYEEAEKLYKSVTEKVNTLKQHKSSMNPETILALLQTASCETEEESDKLAEKFLSGDTDLEGFLEEFLKRRKDMHLRKAKADKMSELLSRRNNSFRPSINNIQQTTAGYPQPGYPNSFYFQPTSMPYPNVPINMPMPGNQFINRQY
ncbi:PREDICTED: vacuolar protein sorting-associated protein 37B [Diuraphis noxia]|uniref:vacuolar protein sorting-associated protein 37B n=1 Tax=Diuraphis noxia TaxID=143948 RepID=UPI000763755D|nr:PREDICTED: vacuolar protein sorting-associated protein 37B [Diuraphis noxia]